MIRTFYVSLGLSLGLAIMSLRGGVEHANLLAHVASVLVTLQLGLIALIAPSLTSSTVSGELESGTFEMLRLAPLGAGKSSGESCCPRCRRPFCPCWRCCLHLA